MTGTLLLHWWTAANASVLEGLIKSSQPYSTLLRVVGKKRPVLMVSEALKHPGGRGVGGQADAHQTDLGEEVIGWGVEGSGGWRRGLLGPGLLGAAAGGVVHHGAAIWVHKGLAYTTGHTLVEMDPEMHQYILLNNPQNVSPFKKV